MSGHTPGPWRSVGYEIVDTDNELVATTSTPRRLHPEERANGRLIAAAPDVLAERDQLRAQVEAMRDVVKAVRTWRDLSEEAAGKRLISKTAWLAIQDAATAVLEALDVLDRVEP